ncbi:hypothetical protein, partial [Okeania sp. SIO2G5]|uniref:hypothetical protein n=1 Tax=Okeania sp. SIO2G5 TaxID=2607796 RepID=UPI0013C17CC0
MVVETAPKQAKATYTVEAQNPHKPIVFVRLRLLATTIHECRFFITSHTPENTSQPGELKWQLIKQK